MDPAPPPPQKRIKRSKKQHQPAKKCHIGQPQPVISNQEQLQCRLCHQSLVTVERSFGTSGGEKTVLLICGECSGILENLDKFRKKAFSSFRFLLDRSGEIVRQRLCRFCFVTGDGLVDLFDEHGMVLVQKLLDQLRDWLEIVIDFGDAVTTLCRACIRSVIVIATLRIEPSMDIVYGSSKYMKKKQAQERRDAREEADQNLLELFQTPHEGRNFSIVTSDVDPTIQVLFQGHQYRLIKQKPSGTTSWKCVYQRLHHCKALLEINPAGTSVSSAKPPSHKHPAGPDQILQHPQGKFLTTVDGTPKQPFYLTYGASGKSPYTRTLYLAGHRYYLMSIRNDGAGSSWCCNRSWDTACKVRLAVEGIFEEIRVINELHQHEPYRKASIERYMRDCGVEVDGEKKVDVAEKKQEEVQRADREDAAPIENIEEQITAATVTAPLTQLLNFSVKQSVNQKVQITFNGHDFRWVVDKAKTGWCCIWHEIRRCPVRIQLSSDGKVASLVDPGAEHNHSDEVIAIFWHKFGKNVVFDEQESCELQYRLFEDKSEDSPNRRMEYQGYRYGLVSILDNGDSVWKCERCEGTVRVMGLFWIVDYRCLHDHEPLEELSYDEDLLPYKSTGMTNSTPRSPSALLKLLSIDEPERNFQMHFQGDLMKILQDGYEYFYSCSKPTYSLWKCFYSTIRGCGATLHVENFGRIGTPSPFSQHNHSIELWDLYYHRLGEGSILNESTNTHQPFFFLMKPDFMRPLPYILHEDHLLTMIFITEFGERSKWRCVADDCAVTANVTGLFERICVEGLPHGDEPLGEEEKRQLIGDYGTPDEF